MNNDELTLSVKLSLFFLFSCIIDLHYIIKNVKLISHCYGESNCQHHCFTLPDIKSWMSNPTLLSALWCSTPCNHDSGQERLSLSSQSWIFTTASPPSCQSTTTNTITASQREKKHNNDPRQSQKQGLKWHYLEIM